MILNFIMNRSGKKKVGHPFKITDRYVEFLAIMRYLLSIPYISKTLLEL
jgi:hypothetical protein